MRPREFASVFGAASRLLGLMLAVTFHVAWLAQPASWPLKLLHVGLITLAVTRPANALLMVAALAPLTTSIAALLDGTMAGWSLVVAMLWALATGFLVRHTPLGSALRLRAPAILLAVVVISSALVAIAGDPLFITEYSNVGAATAALLSGQLFEWSGPWVSLHHALVMSLSVFVAFGTERAIRADRQLSERLVRMLLVGHAAAVALTLTRLAAAAMGDGPWSEDWMRLVSEVRLHSQYDMNAAGSILVIVACAGLGLWTMARPWTVAPGLLLVLMGIWFTGSRAALVAFIAVVALRALAGLLGSSGRRAWLGGAATIGAAAAVAIALYAYYPAGRNVSTSVAWESRSIMLRTAWRAGLSDPLYGVGLGRLPHRGPEFGSDDMRPLMGEGGTRENAHNQFLQVFAETGLLGLIAFAFFLGSAGWIRGLGSTGDALLSWTSWGILASLLTWLLGHPLLVPQAAVIFWLFLGITAGLSPAPAVHGPWRLSRVGGLMLAALLTILLPLRVSSAARSTYLEHQGIGITAAWRHDDEVPYRLAGTHFSLFLPSARSVVVPLRALPSGDAVVVEIFLRGRLVDRIEVTTDVWRHVVIVLPASDRQFERVEFVVIDAGGDANERELLRVGRTTER